MTTTSKTIRKERDQQRGDHEPNPQRPKQGLKVMSQTYGIAKKSARLTRFRGDWNGHVSYVGRFENQLPRTECLASSNRLEYEPLRDPTRKTNSDILNAHFTLVSQHAAKLFTTLACFVSNFNNIDFRSKDLVLNFPIRKIFESFLGAIRRSVLPRSGGPVLDK